jgi:anti-anti-sigma factor
MIGLSVLVMQLEGRCRVYLRGELDLNTAWRLRQDLETAWGVVEFDCSELEFVDCCGLTVWIERRQKDGAVILVNASPQIRSLLAVCGLLEEFAVTAQESACELPLGDAGSIMRFPFAS